MRLSATLFCSTIAMIAILISANMSFAQDDLDSANESDRTPDLGHPIGAEAIEKLHAQVDAVVEFRIREHPEKGDTENKTEVLRSLILINLILDRECAKIEEFDPDKMQKKFYKDIDLAPENYDTQEKQDRLEVEMKLDFFCDWMYEQEKRISEEERLRKERGRARLYKNAEEERSAVKGFIAIMLIVKYQSKAEIEEDRRFAEESDRKRIEGDKEADRKWAERQEKWRKLDERFAEIDREAAESLAELRAEQEKMATESRVAEAEKKMTEELNRATYVRKAKLWEERPELMMEWTTGNLEKKFAAEIAETGFKVKALVVLELAKEGAKVVKRVVLHFAENGVSKKWFMDIMKDWAKDLMKGMAKEMKEFLLESIWKQIKPF